MRLNKRNIISGIKCEKALFLEKFHPELKKALGTSAQKRINDGIFVGKEARKYFPEGVLMADDLELALRQTSEALQNGSSTIFEAAIINDDIVVRPDILYQTGPAWNLYEVKAATYKDKPDKWEHQERLQDVAIQVYVLKKAGWKIDRVFLTLLNTECRYPNLENLFVHVDVSQEILKILEELPKEVDRLRHSLSLHKEPVIDIGDYCLKPRECPFVDYCWKHIPSPSIFNIPNYRKKWDLYHAGKLHIEDLAEEKFSDIQNHMIQSTQENKRFIDKALIKKELLKWKYPLISLDFETIDYPIPRFEGMKPYQKLPFQFSCHIQEHINGGRLHFEYLHEDETDPRLSLAEALIRQCPEEGSVVAYHMSTEKGVLMDLAIFCPQYREKLSSIAERLVDPLPLVKNVVYDPKFLGSFSLKSVAPALLGEQSGYTGMAVAEGMGAVVKYIEFIGTIPGEAKLMLKKQLQEYCQKDTSLPLDLIDWFWNEID